MDMPLVKSDANDVAGEIRPIGDCAARDSWPDFVQAFRHPARTLFRPWDELFAPLRVGAIDDLVVVGQIGQSLDGRIATDTGHSHYINGPAGLAHLHRLRSLVDAVLVGVGTAIADDPQLTVRRVAGPQSRRAWCSTRKAGWPPAPRFSTADGVPPAHPHREGAAARVQPGVEVVGLAGERWTDRAGAPSWRRSPQRGLRRILIEGGADTVSRFLAAGCLDRLHVIVAPIIIGTGRASFVLPPIERAEQALRVPMRRIPARRRGAVRLRPVGSARAESARQKNRRDRRRSDERPAATSSLPACQPAADVGDGNAPISRAALAQPANDLGLNRAILRPEASNPPVRARPNSRAPEFGDRVAGRVAARAPAQSLCRRADAHSPHARRRVERIGGRDRDPPVVAQRRINRHRSRRDLDRQPLQPEFGDEIEQRRGGDQIDRPVERGFEIAIEVERRPSSTVHAAALPALGRARQQAEIVVDQPPVLRGRQPRRRARAASSRCRRRDRRCAPGLCLRTRRRPHRAPRHCARACRNGSRSASQSAEKLMPAPPSASRENFADCRQLGSDCARAARAAAAHAHAARPDLR